MYCKEDVDLEHASTIKSETQKHNITEAQSSASFCRSWAHFREFGGYIDHDCLPVAHRIYHAHVSSLADIVFG